MSDDSQEPVDEISRASKKTDEWVVKIGARLENPSISHATRISMDSNIEKYPSIIGKWQCWDDFGSSLIPETYKWHYVACMTHCFGLNLRSYLEYMQENEDLTWSYYRGVDEKFRAENSEGFIEHLLVNSCFILFAMLLREYRTCFLNTIHENNLPKGLTLRDIENLSTFISQNPLRTKCYMLTMNYQIPLFVLQAVYTELSNLSKLFVTPIHKIALSRFKGLNPHMHPSKEDGGAVPEGGFKHLLHIFHWSRTPDGKYMVDYSKFSNIGSFHIPSATELQLSQTVFKKVIGGDSIDMSYSHKRLSGVMQLTPWYLSLYSTKRYESLIRFEEHYGRWCGFPFTAYVVCMSCLLKTEADVGVLRAVGIFPSTSFDDKDVLCCVQELRTLIADNRFMPDELLILEEKVMTHHKKSVYRVIGEFKKRYCSNTWIIISVVAGICLFVLTFIQTIYGTLSYYKQ